MVLQLTFWQAVAGRRRVHRPAHRKPKKRGPKPKLSPKQRQEIKAAAGPLRHEDLATLFGVSGWTIYMIRSGRQRLPPNSAVSARHLGEGLPKVCAVCHQEYRVESNPLIGNTFEVCACGVRSIVPRVAVAKPKDQQQEAA